MASTHPAARWRRHTPVLLVILALGHAGVARAQDPERIGPFSIASDDGDWSLQPGLSMQLKYELSAVDLEEPDTRDLADKVEARRIRPTLRGTILSKDLSFYFHLSTAPGSVEFMDFFFDYTWRPCLRARVGQWKIPFTRFRTGSYRDLTLVEWPIVTTYFGAERQMGLALHNGYDKPPAVQYEVGVFSGVNARASHAVGLSSVYGEKIENPSDLAHPGPRPTLHPEFVAHVAYNRGEIDLSTDTDWQGGPLRLSTGLSGTWDLDPERYADLAMRVAPELLLKVHGLSAFGVLYLGFVRRGDGVADQRLGMLGGVIQTSYLIRQRVELSARYALVHILAKIVDDARRRAEQIVAAETDPDEHDALAQQYKRAGQLRREHETTLGVNYYLIGRSLKLQTDVSWLAHDRIDRRHHDFRFRCQLTMTF